MPGRTLRSGEDHMTTHHINSHMDVVIPATMTTDRWTSRQETPSAAPPRWKHSPSEIRITLTHDVSATGTMSHSHNHIVALLEFLSIHGPIGPRLSIHCSFTELPTIRQTATGRHQTIDEGILQARTTCKSFTTQHQTRWPSQTS
jgi:hypothetical protein